MLNQLLPSLQTLGIWGYWVVGLMAFLEALILTSVFAPGTVAVVLGGALAAQGVYEWGDMIWFVAMGTCLGAELSYRIGSKGEALFQESRPVLSSENLERSRRFFARFGAASIVIGHFFGPLRPIAPVIAGVSHMPHRTFMLWNILGSLAYAAVFVGIGYFFGSTFSVLGPATTRVGLFVLGVLAAFVVLWFIIVRVRRALPLAASVLRSIGRAIRDNPDVQAVANRHPRAVRILSARLSRESFLGLPATVLGAAFLYFLVLYAGLTEDYVTGDPIIELDLRLANLLFAFRDPTVVRFFTGVTTFGYWEAILVVAVATSVLLWLGRRLH
jgi:membrane protein DedA with SNARE-associated domain